MLPRRRFGPFTKSFPKLTSLCLAALAAGTGLPGRAAADEEDDAKAMLASAHKKKPDTPKEDGAGKGTESPQEGHGPGSHPDDDTLMAMDPETSEGHGATHDLSEGETDTPLKIRHGDEEHPKVSSSGTEQHTATASKTAPHKSRAFWEDGAVWFVGVFVALLITFFVFL